MKTIAVDKYYFAIKVYEGPAESGSVGMGVERVTTTGNAKTTTESSMETKFKSVIDDISIVFRKMGHG
jgi:hypothetical protein